MHLLCIRMIHRTVLNLPKFSNLMDCSLYFYLGNLTVFSVTGRVTGEITESAVNGR